MVHIKKILKKKKKRIYCIAQGSQYSVMTYMGKESKKKWIYVYV